MCVCTCARVCEGVRKVEIAHVAEVGRAGAEKELKGVINQTRNEIYSSKQVTPFSSWILSPPLSSSIV